MKKRNVKVVRRWRMAYMSVYPEREMPQILERGGGWWNINGRPIRVSEIAADARRLERKAKRLEMPLQDAPHIERSVEQYLRAHHGITQQAIERALELLSEDEPCQALDVLKKSRIEVDEAINSYCPELAGKADSFDEIVKFGE